jgi:hypothetical protein
VGGGVEHCSILVLNFFTMSKFYDYNDFYNNCVLYDEDNNIITVEERNQRLKERKLSRLAYIGNFRVMQNSICIYDFEYYKGDGDIIDIARAQGIYH